MRNREKTADVLTALAFGALIFLCMLWEHVGVHQ